MQNMHVQVKVMNQYFEINCFVLENYFHLL